MNFLLAGGSNPGFVHNNQIDMMILKRSAIVVSLLLAACAHAPQKAAVVQPEQEDAPVPVVEQPLNLPKLELTGEMIYEFLLGDVASQRGNQPLAAQAYMSLANETQDPRVARRAAQLAFDAHLMDQSVEALKLWLKLEPTSHQARQLLIMVLLSGGKLTEAQPYLVDALAEKPDQTGRTFMQIYSLLVRHPDREAVLNLLHDLARPYPDVAEAHLVLAQAAVAAGKREQALEEVRSAYALHPEWAGVALLEAQLLLPDSPQQALALLKKYLDGNPEASDVRLLYARTLLDQKQYPAARKEFQRLLDKHPESADMAFAVAMLSLEMGERDRAESELRQALAKGEKNESTVYYYLGQLNEAKNNDEEALQNYRHVTDAEYTYAASLRIAYLLSKEGKLDEAREELHQTIAQNSQQRVQLWLIEAQLLNKAKQVETAYQVLTQALDKLPNHPELLYEAAMLADQLGKHDVFERMMRKVIEVRPESAQAYNALGYSLLDRNERLEEGMRLVEKANQLAPDDAAIMDSVGWGYYRTGDLSKGLEFLRRAYSANPDPEIAAHLGEVLWMQGVKDQAEKIWGDALKLHPDNVVLQNTMKKFIP